MPLPYLHVLASHSAEQRISSPPPPPSLHPTGAADKWADDIHGEETAIKVAPPSATRCHPVRGGEGILRMTRANQQQMGVNLIDIWAPVAEAGEDRRPASRTASSVSKKKRGSFQRNHFLSSGPCLLILCSPTFPAPLMPPSSPIPLPATHPPTHRRATCQILIACVLPLCAIFPLPPQEQPQSSSEASKSLEYVPPGLTLCWLQPPLPPPHSANGGVEGAGRHAEFVVCVSVSIILWGYIINAALSACIH